MSWTLRRLTGRILEEEVIYRRLNNQMGQGE
jgi:hypothetical protein